MRILFNSKQVAYKSPFGALTPGQSCELHIHIPSDVNARSVRCLIQSEDGRPVQEVSLEYRIKRGPYDIFRGSFSLAERGLYFYYFSIVIIHTYCKIL